MNLLSKLKKTRTNSTNNFIELSPVEVNVALHEYCARNGVLIPENSNFEFSRIQYGVEGGAWIKWTVHHEHDGESQ